jgi:acyl-CoA thioester hydrolase
MRLEHHCLGSGFQDAEVIVNAIGVKSIFDLRVYYEDTDFSGRVYHASYLRFLERGRTEWLRALGFDHKTLAGEVGLFFAVRGLQIEYVAPALMDDALTIETEFVGTRGAVIELDQQILRRGQLLVHASVRVVTIRNDRPVRAPRDLLALGLAMNRSVIDSPVQTIGKRGEPLGGVIADIA